MWNRWYIQLPLYFKELNIQKKFSDLNLTVLYNRVQVRTQPVFGPAWRDLFVCIRSVLHMSNHFSGQRSEKLSRLFMT